MKPFLIVKTGGTFSDYSNLHGDFEDWTACAMALAPDQWECVNLQAGEKLPAPGDYAGIVLTGAHEMVTDDRKWIHDTAKWVRESVAGGFPMLGICFGHQLMAMALGGEAGFHPEGPEIGTMDIRLTEAAPHDPLFSQMPGIFPGHTTHYQCALTMPPKAVLICASEHEPHQAFRVGDHAWGVQFHPEFDAEAMRLYLTRQEETIAEHGGNVAQLLSNVRETKESTGLMKLFVSYCRELEAD